MAQNARVAFSLLLLPAVLALIPAAVTAHDTRPCRPFHALLQRPPKPDRNFEVRVMRVDAGDAAAPLVAAALASASNREDQVDHLREEVRHGAPVLRIVYYPTVGARQNDVKTSRQELLREARLAQSGPELMPATRSRVTAHPRLTAWGKEIVEISIEQVPVGVAWDGQVFHMGFVFENGDTNLLNDTRAPDGTHHLLYATVFYPPSVR